MRLLIFLIAIVSIHTASKIFKDSTEAVPVPSEYHKRTIEGTTDSLYHFNTKTDGRVLIISQARCKKRVN